MMIVVAAICFAAGGLFGMLLTAVLVAGRHNWEAEQKGYTCNDCYLAMQNCHDMSICCEDETGLCDWFEEILEEEEQG